MKPFARPRKNVLISPCTVILLGSYIKAPEYVTKAEISHVGNLSDTGQDTNASCFCDQTVTADKISRSAAKCSWQLNQGIIIEDDEWMRITMNSTISN